MIFSSELPIAYLTVAGMSDIEEAERIGRKCSEFADEVRGPWFLVTDIRGFKIAAPAGRDRWIQNMRRAARNHLAGWYVVTAPGMASFQAQNVSTVAELRDITFFTTSFDEADARVRAAALRLASR